jgi:hypothetical protein
MNAVVDVIKALSPVVGTGFFTLGAVWLTQRDARRTRADDRAAAEIAKVEDAARELVNAVSSLQIVLVQSVPLSNSWQPKLLVLGSAFLEFTAASKTGGLEQGLLQATRTTVAHQAQEIAGLDRHRISSERVFAALAAVAILPDRELRKAGERIGDTVGASGQAYGKDALWRPKRAATERAKADEELSEAIADLLRVVDQRRAAAPRPVRWWRRAVRRLRPGKRHVPSRERREMTAAQSSDA